MSTLLRRGAIPETIPNNATITLHACDGLRYLVNVGRLQRFEEHKLSSELPALCCVMEFGSYVYWLQETFDEFRERLLELEGAHVS